MTLLNYKEAQMKKVLIISILLSGICFAQSSYAEHEAQMNQMRTQTKSGSAVGSGQKKQYKYQYGKSSDGQTGSGSDNQYKGSKGKGGRVQR